MYYFKKKVLCITLILFGDVTIVFTTDPSTFPPASEAAISSITDPGFMVDIMGWVMSTGAGRPLCFFRFRFRVRFMRLYM